MPIVGIEVTIINNATGEQAMDFEWTSISGLDGTELKACKPPKTSKRQKPVPSDITLSGPARIASRQYLVEWSRAAFLNPKTEEPLRDMIIVLRNDDASEAARYNLFDCLPTRWYPADLSSSSSDVATETIVCKMQRVELQ